VGAWGNDGEDAESLGLHLLSRPKGDVPSGSHG
jgi:hypothetical protein